MQGLGPAQPLCVRPERPGATLEYSNRRYFRPTSSARLMAALIARRLRTETTSPMFCSLVSGSAAGDVCGLRQTTDQGAKPAAVTLRMAVPFIDLCEASNERVYSRP